MPYNIIVHDSILQSFPLITTFPYITTTKSMKILKLEKKITKKIKETRVK